MSANPAPTRGPRVVFEDAVWSSGFTQIPNAFLRCKGLDPDTKMVLITLMSYGYKQDELPDQDELAADLNRSPRWLWGKLKELQRRNIIEVKRFGLNLPNDYEIKAFHNWNLGPLTLDSHASANQTGTRLRILDWKASANQEPHTSANPLNKVQDTPTTNKKIDEDRGAAAPAADAAPPPEPAPVIEKKPRTPSLKQADPETWQRAEAIKAHWLAKLGMAWAELPTQRQRYIRQDLEHLAAHYPVTSVTAAMDAAWAEQWRDGTYPARRAGYRLTALPEKIAELKRGGARGTPQTARPINAGKEQCDRITRDLTTVTSNVGTGLYVRNGQLVRGGERE